MVTRRVSFLLPSLLGLLLSAVVNTAAANERRTVPLPVAEPEEAAPVPPPRSAKPDPEPMAWGLQSSGSWSVDLSGDTRLVKAANTLVASMQDETWPFPIQLAVTPPAGGGEVQHVPFQTEPSPRGRPTSLVARASNLLIPATRKDYPRGHRQFLRMVDGTVRIDRRDNGPNLRFVAQAVECEPRSEPPYYSDSECGVTLAALTGRSARITGWICPKAMLAENPERCEGELTVDAVTPTDERENVDPEQPRLTATFSDPIELDTLDDAFRLYTRNASGHDLEVTGEWTRGDEPTRYDFSPTGGFDIRPGITLEAEIKGGEDGVQALHTEHVLDEDHRWRFSTWLDMTADDNRHEFDARMHTFQVVRDVELTVNKPTLTRTYVDWDLYDDIHTDWQPESYQTRVELTPEHARWTGQYRNAPRTGQQVRIWRDDRFTDEDRRRAHHTINHFGWRPERSDDRLELILQPFQPWPESSTPPEGRYDKRVDVWQHDPDALTIHYTAAMIGSWRRGIPPEDWQRLLATMDTARRMVPQFFPWRRAETASPGFVLTELDPGFGKRGETVVEVPNLEFGRMAADAPAPPSLLEQAMSNQAVLEVLGWDQYLPDGAQDPSPAAADQHVVEDLVHAGRLMLPLMKEAELLQRNLPPDALLIVYVPQDFFDIAGLGFGMAIRGGTQAHLLPLPGMKVVLATILDPDIASVDMMAQVVLHEIGHELGLTHLPANAAGLPPRMKHVPHVDIEGWRMSPDGLSGANKSSTEGNGEAPNVMTSMMWPYQIDTREMGVTHAQYRAMMQAIANVGTQ